MSKKRHPIRITRSAHGIRAQDLRTLVRNAWWARRWIASLEGMRLGARLGRGRQYAVAGQVTELTVDGAHVEARITGSRPDPYRVTLDFTVPPAPARERIVKALKAAPMLLARVLTDDLPTEVEELFRREGAALFPTGGFELGKDGRKRWDVAMDCSCPDWSRPCKHLAAVMFLLGEEVARRPATLLALRGVDMEDLAPGEEAVGAMPGLAGEADAELLLRRLGPVPFWRGETKCVEAFERIRQRVRPVAAKAAAGESIDLRD